MRAYGALFSARFRTLLQYRAAALAGLVTQLFFGFVRVMVFDAFYRATSAAQPMTFPQVVTYVWLNQAMLLIGMFRLDGDVREMIRSGTVAYELVRPLDLYGLWYVRSVAQQTAPVLLRAVPVFIVAGLFLGLQAPASVASGVLWVVSTAGAVFLSASVATVLTISLMWTVSGDGISRLVSAAVFLFSGMVVPLPLWPDWIQPLLTALPFRGVADVPFRLYMGHIAPGEAWAPLAQQAVWTVVFMALGRLLLARGMRRVVVQGG